MIWEEFLKLQATKHEEFLKRNEQGRYECQKYEDYYFLKEDERIYVYNLSGVKARVLE